MKIKRKDHEILKNIKDGDIIGYDVITRKRFPIYAYVYYASDGVSDPEDEICFECNGYRCVYTLNELLDSTIVELAEENKNENRAICN